MTSLNPTGNQRHGLGEVAEWSKANDSKSFEGKPSVGSNPTLSVLTGSEEIHRHPKPPAGQAFSPSPSSREIWGNPAAATVADGMVDGIVGLGGRYTVRLQALYRQPLA